MITQTQTRLRSLRLTGMADALEVQREHTGTYENLSFEERLALLVDQEDAERNDKRLARLLKAARFKLAATIEGIDYGQARGISQSQMTTLVTCDWINRKQNLLITGPSAIAPALLYLLHPCSRVVPVKAGSAVPSGTLPACGVTVFVTGESHVCCTR